MDSIRSHVPRPRYLVAGITILLLAALMPTGWYDAIPRRADLPPLPFRGVDLLRLTLVIEGLFLVWLATRQRAFRPIAAANLLPDSDVEIVDPVAETRARVILALVTVLALVLRIIAINADLWLDEITPILDYGPLPVIQVIGSYLRSNNHLLNTLLIKGAIALLGEHEWVVRLPAVVLGVATVPALYFVGRLALSRPVSLGAALLLAVSYHHIFFSQNARGYSAYILFAVVASGLFARALSTDRVHLWILYVVTMFLGFASLLNMAFVGFAHGVTGLIVLIVIWRRGGSPVPLLRRLASVFAAAAFLGFQLYATALPEVMVVISTTYANKATGFAPFSIEFVREISRGIGAGFGPGIVVAAVPFLAIAGAGYLSLLRRNWTLGLALTLPGVLTVVFLLVRGLTFSPRFFLLWLPLAMLAAAQGVWLTATLISRRGGPAGRTSAKVARQGDLVGAGALTVLVVVSLLALPRYYRTPKQAYRAALRHVESIRRPGDRVVVMHTAEKGVRYYLPRIGVDPAAYLFVRTLPAFDSLSAEGQAGRILVMTTFRRVLRMNIPELNSKLEQGWKQERVFPGTVGDGSIAVWIPNAS